MPLEKQVHIYSVDTSTFYNKDEKKIHSQLNILYTYRKELTRKRNKYIKKYKKSFKNNKWECDIKKKISLTNKVIKKCKNTLLDLLKQNKQVRNLNEKYLIDKNVISVFESTLTRLLDINENELSKDLIVVKAYFFDVLENIILDGFILQNERYVPLTASAGQIRTKKTVFIKEDRFKDIEKSITCGLTLDIINSKGGINVNKYLAYLALSNSATDVWKDFDIDKAIVVDDMEFEIEQEVDFIDETDYSITRKIVKIPINHTDGCGIILSKSRKAFMGRLPWIKGLLEPFWFTSFIKEKSSELGVYCGKIKDIYGREYDIIEDGIEIIFTKSQFKMARYYDSWDQYKENFKKYNCQAGKCNEEENQFSNAKLNYQMLQTLTDITNKEIKELSKLTIDNINKLGKDRYTMLKVLGVTKANNNKNYLQQALDIYPELLNDTYCKEILKQIKKKLVKEGRSAKLDLGETGVYTFIVPDLYAFCSWLFLNHDNKEYFNEDGTPKGLLKDKEVYCKLFKDKPKLDCLRSPHLYREHAIRNNVIDEEKTKWFITNGLYTSCHDSISKMLMFDVDGDKSLVCCHNTLLNVAERNMDDIVPLYYNMKKADPQIINKNSIFKGLKDAYTGGNIGIKSNNISKIWNSDNVNLDIIKLLCMENNFVIDYAKTLYKPIRPEDKKDLIVNYTKLKLPHFFIYAKGKDKSKVEIRNKSVVNKLEKIIPNPNLNFNAMNLGSFDYTKLMNDKDIDLDENIINTYKKLDLNKRFIINKDDDKVKNVRFLYNKIKNKILEVNNDVYYVTDVLVKYLYEKKKSNYKTTLWECFGDIIVQNLKNNVKQGCILCEKCGKRIKTTSNRKKYCESCWKEINQENNRRYAREGMRKLRENRNVKGLENRENG